MDMFLQITTQYSNAVLVAILPHISEFAQKLELPVPTPVQASQVATFKVDPLKSNPGGTVVLTNGYRFWFYHGYVESFHSPDPYYQLQEVERVSEFVGELRVSKKEAIALVEKSIQQLGYDLTEVFADVPPKVTGPSKLGKKVIPRYLIKWLDPHDVIGTFCSAEAEVNGETGRIESLSLGGGQLWRSPPIPVPALPVSDAWLADVSQKAATFAHKSSLSFPLPVQRNQIDPRTTMFNPTDYNLVLTNGYTIGSGMAGAVFGLRMPGSFFGRNLTVPIRQYHGAWKLSERRAIEIARRTVRAWNPPALNSSKTGRR